MRRRATGFWAFQATWADGGGAISLFSAWLHRQVIVGGSNWDLIVALGFANPYYFDIMHL